MNPEEVAALLAYVAALDNREVTREMVLAWSPLLEMADGETAIEAVQHHFATSTEYLVPAHVVSYIRDKRRRDAEGRPSAPLALPSPFEPDPDRVQRLIAGSELARGVVADVLDRRRGASAEITDGMSDGERRHALALQRARRERRDAEQAARAQQFAHPMPPLPMEPNRADPNRQGAHCGRAGCPCTHTEGCDGGLIEMDADQPGHEGKLRPCFTCKPHARAIFESTATRAEKLRMLRQTGRDIAETDRRRGGSVPTEQAW